MTQAESQSRRLSSRRLLALILLSGLALRLIYAVHEPNLKRFVDEHWALENVQSIVFEGTFKPARYFYPSPVFNLPPAALVAASNALYRVSGDRSFLAIDEQGKSHAAAILLCRLLMVAYGTVSIWFVFLIGRRLFSSRVGLVAAAMMAFTPWMIHSSGNFKPDPLLMMTILLSFYASLRAVADRRLEPYLFAGAAIALAMSSKLTGGLAAVPLIVATGIAWRERRRWILLAAAGLTSATAFVLMNPYWRTYPAGLAFLRRDYEMRAGWQQMTRAEMPRRVFELLLGDSGHGLVFGVLALAGLVALAVRACRPGTAVAERTGLAMMLVFPPVYLAAYAVQTPYFKANNFLPILPFSALAAAWLLTGLWRWAGDGLPFLASRYAGLVAGGAVALWLVSGGTVYVHESVVPSTEDEIQGLLHRRLSPVAGRSVVIEPAARRGSRWEGRITPRIAQITVDRLDSLPLAALDIADAEIFSEDRLHGATGAFYRSRVERLPAKRIFHFRPRLFKLRGPPLVLLIHQRRLLDTVNSMPLEICADAPACFQTRLPDDLLTGERISLGLWIPMAMAPPSRPLPPIQVAGRTVELIENRRDRTSRYLTTARLEISDPEATEIRFEAARPSERSIKISLYRWAGGPRKAPPSTASKRHRKTDP